MSAVALSRSSESAGIGIPSGASNSLDLQNPTHSTGVASADNLKTRSDDSPNTPPSFHTEAEAELADHMSTPEPARIVRSSSVGSDANGLPPRPGSSSGAPVANRPAALKVNNDVSSVYFPLFPGLSSPEVSHAIFDLHDINAFIHSPLPRGAVLRCSLHRDKTSSLTARFYPTYTLAIEPGMDYAPKMGGRPRLILYAQKKSASRMHIKSVNAVIADMWFRSRQHALGVLPSPSNAAAASPKASPKNGSTSPSPSPSVSGMSHTLNVHHHRHSSSSASASSSSTAATNYTLPKISDSDSDCCGVILSNFMGNKHSCFGRTKQVQQVLAARQARSWIRDSSDDGVSSSSKTSTPRLLPSSSSYLNAPPPQIQQPTTLSSSPTLRALFTDPNAPKKPVIPTSSPSVGQSGGAAQQQTRSRSFSHAGGVEVTSIDTNDPHPDAQIEYELNRFTDHPRHLTVTLPGIRKELIRVAANGGAAAAPSSSSLVEEFLLPPPVVGSTPASSQQHQHGGVKLFTAATSSNVVSPASMQQPHQQGSPASTPVAPSSQRHRSASPFTLESNNAAAVAPAAPGGEQLQESADKVARNSIAESYLNATTAPVVLHSNQPRWNSAHDEFLLNFQGRAPIPSMKNFQLVETDVSELQLAAKLEQEKQNSDNKNNKEGSNANSGVAASPSLSATTSSVVLQMGKQSEHDFNIDIRYPLTPLQAFAIALTQFDFKIGVD